MRQDVKSIGHVRITVKSIEIFGVKKGKDRE